MSNIHALAAVTYVFRPPRRLGRTKTPISLLYGARKTVRMTFVVTWLLIVYQDLLRVLLTPLPHHAQPLFPLIPVRFRGKTQCDYCFPIRDF